MYALGGIGAGGHWYGRLHDFLKDRVKLTHAVGITRWEDKKHILERYGLAKEGYYQIVHDASIPDGFYEGIDIVHVASHNHFHARQTRETLEHGVPAIVEKTLATDEAGVEDVLRFAKQRGMDGKVSPHVHYLEKALTLEWRNRLWPMALSRAGRLKRATATFIEDVSEEDLRRQWLFRKENGGIFMDWIHPSAMLAHVAGATFESVEEVTGYVVNPAYDPANATGIEARFQLRGENLAPNCTATVRVGKGFPNGVRHKRMRLEFEKGAVLDLHFTDTETEIEEGRKGHWTFKDGGESSKGKASGPSSYELLVDEMAQMIEGKGAPVSAAEVRKIFRPVWLVLAALGEPERDAAAVAAFEGRAVALAE